MRGVFSSPTAFAALTFVVYAAALGLYRRTRSSLAHPVLVSIVVLIAILRAADVDYAEYRRGGDFIMALLAPAVVALGVPLYREFTKIRGEAGAIVLTTVFGSLVGIVSAAVPAVLFGLDPAIVVSLAPKSVTTPIAMEIAGMLGGVPSFAAVMVILTGVLGAVVGPAALHLLRVTEESAFGLAMGIAAHGVGTARAFEQGDAEGAFSSLGLCLNGLATSILTPLIIKVIL
ncbi:MAG: LrgB family protein [Spirochaetia bacterium]|jgi:predicted murein hydrolase (TIGR00659 family)|nr:LrgB family protein [Spirochaetia bacterium]